MRPRSARSRRNAKPSRIRELVRAVLKELGPSFARLYSSEVRPIDPAGAIAERFAVASFFTASARNGG